MPPQDYGSATGLRAMFNQTSRTLGLAELGGVAVARGGSDGAP